MPLPWRVEMFGGLRVVQSDRTITRFQTQKTGSLLAYLAVNLESTHPREALAELLWPGADPVAVRNRLNQAVSSLRRQLEPPEVVYGSVLITDQRSVRLNPESIETDVGEFTKAVQEAEKANSAEEKKGKLKLAIDLYTGDFLHGYYADWSAMEQLRLADLYTSALFDMLDASRDTGDVELAIRAATLLLKDDPTDEGTHCDLMRLYLDAGRPAAAKRQFEELVRILAAEEEIPSDEAYDLNREASSMRASTPKPIQVVVQERPAEPLSSVPLSQTLPTPLNRFVGREKDLAKILEMLDEESTRLVTILGIGGCGKTRLALQAAHLARENFGSVSFVALADIRDGKQIEEAIARAVGIREAENIVMRLRQNERSLLVLDNLEHLVEDAALVVQALLEAVPGLRCLTTSRRPMRIDAERCYPLNPLPSPPETDSIGELIQSPSVALFVDRAQAALPDFQLTPRNAEIVKNLCIRLEGLPLAIELAASWAKTVAPSQMLAMLDDRFALLESRRRDISPRHRTMRAVIDSGVGLLPVDLAVLFRRLSVFHGGWTLEAAASVCQRPDVLRAMDDLAEQSLIQSQGSDGEAVRFDMLDTLRDFAAEQLPGDEFAETSNLHAEFYSKFASRVSDEIRRDDPAAGSRRIEIEYGNLSAAFEWYLTHDLIEPALGLANSLAAFWEFKGRAREGRRWLETCIHRIHEGPPIASTVFAEAIGHLARLIWIRGDFEESTRWHQQCLDSWIAIGDSEGIVYAQINMQQEAHRTRNYTRSTELLLDNLRRATELDDKILQARAWLGLGNTAIERNHFDEARAYYEHSLRVSREAENPYRIAHALNNLGNLALLSTQHELARHHLTQAYTLFQEAGATPLATGSLLLLAKLERREQNVEAAQRFLSQAWANNPEETYHIQSYFLEQAHAAALRQDPMLAAILIGFVESQREASGALNYDIEKNEFEALLSTVKSALPESAYLEAWSLGRTHDIAEALSRIPKG